MGCRASIKKYLTHNSLKNKKLKNKLLKNKSFEFLSFFYILFIRRRLFLEILLFFQFIMHKWLLSKLRLFQRVVLVVSKKAKNVQNDTIDYPHNFSQKHSNQTKALIFPFGLLWIDWIITEVMAGVFNNNNKKKTCQR